LRIAEKENGPKKRAEVLDQTIGKIYKALKK
jgi:hypothetical protein